MVCTIGSASSGLGEGSASRDVIVPLHSSDSLWRAGRMHADISRRLYSVHSNILLQLTSRLSKQCVKKQCSLAGWCFRGRMALDHHLSRVRTGVAAMGLTTN
jgi:hypothetical protein